MKTVFTINCDADLQGQIEKVLGHEGLTVISADHRSDIPEKDESSVAVVYGKAGPQEASLCGDCAVILITDYLNRMPEEPPEHGIFILAAIDKTKLSRQLPVAVRLLAENPQILRLSRQCSTTGEGESGMIQTGNDPYELAVASNMLGSILFNYGIADRESREHIIMAFMELLINAVEHGHCRISYTEKTALLEEGNDILAILRERIQDPEIKRKRIRIYYSFNVKEGRFTVEDEGDGFNWKEHGEGSSIPDPEHLHGRGIAMARHYLKDLSYNEKGNAVSFTIRL